MRIAEQEYTTVPVKTLKPHPKNPRKGNVKAIADSIEANGFYGAVVVQRSTNYILAGNHRYKAAKQRGAKEIPVLFVDVDDDQALRILLADNRSADHGWYEMDKLAELLKGFDSLEGTGYDRDDLDDILVKIQPPQTPTVPAGFDNQFEAMGKRMIVLEYENENYPTVVEMFGKVREGTETASNAEALSALLMDRYAA